MLQRQRQRDLVGDGRSIYSVCGQPPGADHEGVRQLDRLLTVRSDFAASQQSSGVKLGTGWHNVELCGTVGSGGTWDLYRDGVKIVNAWTADTGTTQSGGFSR